MTSPLAEQPPESIAIVGMECVFPGARDLASYWANIVRERDAIQDVPKSRWNPDDFDFPTARGGFIEGLTEFDPLAHGTMPTAVQEGDPEQFLVLGVVQGALRDVIRGQRLQAGQGEVGPQDGHGPWPARTEVVIGRGGYMSNVHERGYIRMEVIAQFVELLRRIAPEMPPAQLDEIRKLLIAAMPVDSSDVVASAIPNLVAGRVANRLDFLGTNYTVDAACASALIAVEQVVRSLRERRCDLGIAGGVHLVQKPGFWRAFHLLDALTRSGRVRPFAAGADGLLIGEGLGAVVLKRLADAERDGDRIYAVIRGVGTASDGRGSSLLAPRKEGQVLAMRRAYEETGVDPQSVSLIEAHGTGTPVGDAVEIASLHEVFGKEGCPLVALGSVKSMIGHTMPAAGMAGLIKTALAVYHRILPPTLHINEVHPDLVGSRLYLNTRSRPWISPSGTPRRAGVNAFGFGGINTHVLLEERAEKVPAESLTPRSSELFLFAADSRAALVKELEHWGELLTKLGDADLTNAAYTASLRYSSTAPVRLSLTAGNLGELRTRLARAQVHLQESEEDYWTDPEGISFGTRPYPGKVAYLFPGLAFPGLAGGYPERLGELCLHFPEARGYIDFAESLVSLLSDAPYPLRHQFFPPPLLDSASCTRLERELIGSRRTGLAQMMAGLASWSVLHRLEIRADAVAGFSQGEWGALVAGGVSDPEHLRKAVEIYQEQTENPNELGGCWGMVGAPREQVEGVLAGIPGIVSVLLDASPTQVFIGGEEAAVRAALERFRQLGVYGQEIPLRAIHTPLAARLVERMKPLMPRVPVNPPTCPIYCGMTGQPYPNDPDRIRDLLCESLMHPVRMRDTIRTMYEDGVRIFIELGIGGRFPQNNQNILGSAPHITLSMDWKTQPGLQQFHELLGRLAALGVPFSAGRLFAGRRCRELNRGEGSARPRPLLLSLNPPRLRPPDRTIDRIRELIQPPAACPTQPEPEPPTLVSLPSPPGKRGEGRVRANGHALPTEARRPPASGVLGQVQATLEDFLAVQQKHEEADAQLLERFLQVQQQGMLAFLAPAVEPAAQLVGRIGNPSGPQDGLPIRPTETKDLHDAPGQTVRRYPFVGGVLRLVPGQELESQLLLNLDEHLFLADHALIMVPDSLRPAEERLPTLPMTMGIEILAEAAATLAPDLIVVACHGVEAVRWIALEDTRSLLVTIRARRTAESEVEVELFTPGNTKAALRGAVSLGRALPTPPAPLEVPCDRSCPHTAAELYSEGLMFHGPRFQAVTAMRGMSEDSVAAELQVRDPQELTASPLTDELLFDPVVLDGAGQVLGYKAVLEDWMAYPWRVGRVTRYGPPPPAGTTVRTVARHQKLDSRRIRADIEVLGADDRPWMRIEGWQIWHLFCSRDLFHFRHRQRERSISVRWSSRQPGAHCFRLHVDELGEISPDWIARYYLTAREWSNYNEQTSQDWILALVTAKDAVRDWVRKQRGEQIHPAELELSGGTTVESFALPPRGDWPLLAVAQLADEAVAVASPGRGIGVALLRIPNSRSQPEPSAVAECARQAAAQAQGVAAESAAQFVIREVRPDGTVVVETAPDETLEVETQIDKKLVIAIAIRR